jgi:hypothetical protein
MVIMGRRKDIRHEEAVVRWRDMKNTHQLELCTYDDLHDNVLALAKSLRNLIEPDDEHARRREGGFRRRSALDSGDRRSAQTREGGLHEDGVAKPVHSPTLGRQQ